MKKGKFLVLGLLALILAGGLVLAGCDLGRSDCEKKLCSSDAQCVYSTCAVNKFIKERTDAGLDWFKSTDMPKCDCTDH